MHAGEDPGGSLLNFLVVHGRESTDRNQLRQRVRDRGIRPRTQQAGRVSAAGLSVRLDP
jgi:hypothetical protein